MLVIKQLTKTFNQKLILNNIDLSVKRGEIAILLGQSGVGKSTLLRILSNLELADSGTITLDGVMLDPMRINKEHIVGMVFQAFNLFDHLTVEENITLPLQKVLNNTLIDAQKKAYELLSCYELQEKKYAYPPSLSGGQKQRLAIARALALTPQIICLDEPTSALDPLLTTHVAHNIQELAQQNYIVLIATHDTDLLKKLKGMVYLMHEGCIIEAGDSQDLSNNVEKYPLISSFLQGKNIF